MMDTADLVLIFGVFLAGFALGAVLMSYVLAPQSNTTNAPQLGNSSGFPFFMGNNNYQSVNATGIASGVIEQCVCIARPPPTHTR